jgi:TonB family protein
MNSVMLSAARLGQTLIDWVPAITLVSGAMLAVALVLDRFLARRVAASVRLWLYVLVVARLAIPASWHTPFGLLRRSARSESLVTAGVPLLTTAPATGHPTVVNGLAFAIGLLYLAVAVALLARWLRARLSLVDELRYARPASAAAAALLPTATVLEHPGLGPLVAGLVHPRIVLPGSLLAAGDSEALRFVMRHEGAHLARRDQLLTAALQITCLVAWPVLPLWIAAARIRALIELAADERALAGAGVTERRRYGEVLLDLADTLPAPRFALVPSFGSGLRGRVSALAFSRRWPVLPQLGLVAAIGIAVLACAGEPPPLADKQEPTAEVPQSRAGARPDTIPGQASVRGGLDKEIIRRIIRFHINEVKFCYERQLARNPALGGRVVVKFTIDETGRVVSSSLGETTMNSAPVETCVVTAVRRWEFPRPAGGGIVNVAYPFVLTPAGAAPDRTADPATRAGAGSL